MDETQHRIEMLEAEVRYLRQIIRNLTEAVTSDNPRLKELAGAARDLLEEGV